MLDMRYMYIWAVLVQILNLNFGQKICIHENFLIMWGPFDKY